MGELQLPVTTTGYVMHSEAPPGLKSAPATEKSRGAVTARLARLAAVAVWAPITRTNGLVNATGRATIDLPLDSQQSILTALESEAMALTAMRGGRPLAMRVLTNSLGSRLLFGAGNHNAALSVEMHKYEDRGTGGVLSDAVKHYEEDDLVLVMEGPQILDEPLELLLRELAEMPADVSYFAHGDHSAAVMMLVRVGCLRGLPRLGKIDFRSQGLPQISREFRVNVVKRATASGMVFDSLGSYIAALQGHHRKKMGMAAKGARGPVFSVVEAGGEVEPGANLHDAVVLKGGKVHAAGTVVRGMVMAGGVVKRKETRTECLVGRPIAKS